MEVKTLLWDVVDPMQTAFSVVMDVIASKANLDWNYVLPLCTLCSMFRSYFRFHKYCRGLDNNRIYRKVSEILEKLDYFYKRYQLLKMFL
jgi:hypothetical protein